jgi:hypothetical protein
MSKNGMLYLYGDGLALIDKGKHLGDDLVELREVGFVSFF